MYYVYTYSLIAHFYDDSRHEFVVPPAEYQQNFSYHLTGILDTFDFSIFNL